MIFHSNRKRAFVYVAIIALGFVAYCLFVPIAGCGNQFGFEFIKCIDQFHPRIASLTVAAVIATLCLLEAKNSGNG